MRFIINQDGVKREILGAFEVCFGQAEYAALQMMLQKTRMECGEGNEISYGWRTVFAHPHIRSVPNTVPKPWKE